MLENDNSPTTDQQLCNNQNEADLLIQENPFEMLKRLKLKNINRLIIGHLNINSLRNKFEDLKMLCKDNIDILVLTETKVSLQHNSLWMDL